MTEFQELVEDAPKFASMERGELVTYAYAMYAAGAKTDAENVKLRELVADMWHLMDGSGVTTVAWGRCAQILDRMCELGIEVDG